MIARKLLGGILATSIALAACQSASPAASPTGGSPVLPASTSAGVPPASPSPVSVAASPSAVASPALAPSIVASPSSSPVADGPPETPSITVTYGTISGSEAPLWIAADQGIFQKYGLTVDPQLGESSTGIAAILSNSAQINVNDGASAIQAITDHSVRC